MFGKQEIRAFLDEKGLKYEWIDHEAVYTIEDIERLGLDEGEDTAKNLFLRDQKGKRHFLIVIRGDKQANLKELGEKLGVGKLSFASEERLEKYLKLKQGSVTPFGLINDTDHAVEFFIDRSLSKCKSLGIHPCDNTATVFLSYKDLDKFLWNLDIDVIQIRF